MSLRQDVQDSFPPERSYVDNMVEGLRQGGPSGQSNHASSSTHSTNQDVTNKSPTRRLPVKYKPSSPPPVPRLNRPFDDVFRRLREEGGSSRQDRERYRGVQYTQPHSPHMRTDIPNWYIEGQSKLKNPLKYGQPGSKYRQEAQGPSSSPPRPPSPVTRNTNHEPSLSLHSKSANLPTSAIHLVPSITMEDIRQVGGTGNATEDAVQKDIEEAMVVTELYRQTQNLSTTDKGSPYVQTLRRTSFTSSVKNEDALPAAIQQARSETGCSEPESKTLEGVLDYYAQIPSNDFEEDSEPDPPAPLASVKEVADNQWGARAWDAEVEPLSPSQPVLIQVEADDDDNLYQGSLSHGQSLATPEAVAQTVASFSQPTSTSMREESTNERDQAVLEDVDYVLPPPIPPKRRQPQPHAVVSSHSPPHEIKSPRRQPVLVQNDEEDVAVPPVPPKVPLSPILETPRTPKTSPLRPTRTYDEELSHVITRAREHERSQAVAIAAEAEGATASLSIGSMAKQLATEVDDRYSHKDHLRRTDKAFKKMGVIPEETEDPETSKPSPNKITKDLKRLNTRKAILGTDGPKSPTKKLFNFAGTPKSFKAVAGMFGIGRSKGLSESVPNTPKSQQHPRRPSLDPALLLDNTTRPGMFQRFFGASSRPSTSDSNKSFGISLPDSWGSGRGSGETGATSHGEAYESNTPPVTPSRPGHADALKSQANDQKDGSNKKTGSPESSPVKKTDRKEKKQGVKAKRSGFFDVFKRGSGDEKTDSSADEGATRKQKDKGKAKDTTSDASEKKAQTTGPGFYGTKGTFFRAKNPLELELCDDSDIDAYRPAYMGLETPDEEEQPVAESAGTANLDTPVSKHSPLRAGHAHQDASTSEAHQEACADGPKSPKDNIENAVTTPGLQNDSNERSKWSDDSETENPVAFLFKSHKRNGSGSSALGTGPTLMKKAAQRLKGSKKSTPSPDKSSEGSEPKYVPPPVEWAFPPHIPPSASRSASSGNRESSASVVSSGKRDLENQRNSIIAPPPIPPRARPAPISTTPSQLSPASPAATPLTTGTYHDPSRYVVHTFGGMLPERSGSSMGHRGDRVSGMPNMPERSRTSLGHTGPDTQADKPSKAQAKKNKKVEQEAKKEAAKVEKLTRKAEAAAQRHADALNRAGLLSAATAAKKVEEEEAKKPKDVPFEDEDLELRAVINTPQALIYFIQKVQKDLEIDEGGVMDYETSQRVFLMAQAQLKEALAVEAGRVEKEERQKWYREFEGRREQTDYNPVADLSPEKAEGELAKIVEGTEKRRKNLRKLLGEDAMPQIIATEAETQRGWLFLGHRGRVIQKEADEALQRKIDQEAEERRRAQAAEQEREEKARRRHHIDAIRYAIFQTEHYWPEPEDVDECWDPAKILKEGLERNKAKKTSVHAQRQERNSREREQIRLQLEELHRREAQLRRAEEELRLEDERRCVQAHEQENVQGGSQLDDEAHKGEDVNDSQDSYPEDREREAQQHHHSPQHDGEHEADPAYFMLDIDGISDEEEAKNCRIFFAHRADLRRMRDEEVAQHTAPAKRRVVAEFWDQEIERREENFASYRDAILRKKLEAKGRKPNDTPEMPVRQQGRYDPATNSIEI
ncbi:hypothetical protein ABW21_db0206206 [Orbilia brochopaga]|nr:hypothetical protein ABW21_db0206206 [Drechslerella brochopaga]